MLGPIRLLAVAACLVGSWYLTYDSKAAGAAPCANGLDCYTQALQHLQAALDAVKKPQQDIIALTARVNDLTKKNEALQRQVDDLNKQMPILSGHPAYGISIEKIDLRGIPNPHCKELPLPTGVGKFMRCDLPKPAPAPGRIISAVLGRSPESECSGCSFEIGTVTAYNEDGGSMFVYRPAIDAGGHNQPWEWVFEIVVVRELPSGR